MIANTLKALWAQGKPAINGWCSIGNPFTAEIMAAQGFDSVTIDILICSTALWIIPTCCRCSKRCGRVVLC